MIQHFYIALALSRILHQADLESYFEHRFMCICCRYINQELFSAETLVSNCTEKVLDLLN
jgi:hypothetical protein